jgi:uncharacterized metal-binding protein
MLILISALIPWIEVNNTYHICVGVGFATFDGYSLQLLMKDGFASVCNWIGISRRLRNF